MIRVGGTYLFRGAADCLFVVVCEEPYFPPQRPSGYIPGPGFRILILDGEILNPFGSKKAGQQILVGDSSAIACNAIPMEAT